MQIVPDQLKELRTLTSLSWAELAKVFGTSLASIGRWERGDVIPSEAQLRLISELLNKARQGISIRAPSTVLQNGLFASRGIKRGRTRWQRSLFAANSAFELTVAPITPILERVKRGAFVGAHLDAVEDALNGHPNGAATPSIPRASGTSAGKNTYTYDAHTYHTKVPPQGIVDFLRYYLPSGGLVLDPFAGSGMTGVAALVSGYDVILNELSPAAAFIAHNFTQGVSGDNFSAAVDAVLGELDDLRRKLYTTSCRECGKQTEILYTIWSYRVVCSSCETEFLLWDHCRSYGKTVREHKILSTIPCPSCGQSVRKGALRRTTAEPVLIGYKCCRSAQIEHPLDPSDRALIDQIGAAPPLAEGFYPANDLPDGVNLRQPKRHGIDRVDKFYSPRNLVALSHLWRTIHRIPDDDIAAMVAFAFTSLYQRVSRLSEYRFWGGSGNTAHFNVPFIFNEANVFVTFERKANSILDHLETTAAIYSGKRVVVCNSATNLHYLPDNSIDLIFTDPPFGGNINYSEMNFLWESWLKEFTDQTDEAIVNRYQGKDVTAYQQLMTRCLRECYRVLRPGHWMLLVFMNSSAQVWESLRGAVRDAGFAPEKLDIFDKQHGTFKQFVSENTAGADLILHCRKPLASEYVVRQEKSLRAEESIDEFLSARVGDIPLNTYLHVQRDSDVDFRMLYSEWIAYGMLRGHRLLDFASFRKHVQGHVQLTWLRDG